MKITYVSPEGERIVATDTRDNIVILETYSTADDTPTVTENLTYDQFYQVIADRHLERA